MLRLIHSDEHRQDEIIILVLRGDPAEMGFGLENGVVGIDRHNVLEACH